MIQGVETAIGYHALNRQLQCPYKSCSGRTREVEPLHIFLVVVLSLLARGNSTGGASVSASTAIQAGIGIDRIDVAFLDGIGGTY